MTEEVAQRRFKQKSTRAREASSGLATTKKKKKAKKKLTLKKVLDNSGFDKLPPGKANCESSSSTHAKPSIHQSKNRIDWG